MVRRAHGDRPPVARIEGRAASLDEAVDAAAAILRQARAPLVYGLGQTSCEAQRRAVALAEAIGAVVDPAGGGAAGLAFQAIGSSTATFGEIRDRAELVVVWRADPAVTNPRLLERLRWIAPRVAALVVVDAQRTATAEEADAFIELDAAHDFEALWALRALVTGAPLDRDRAREPAARRPRASACSARATSPCIHGALDELGALALFSLVRDLSRDRHAVTLGAARRRQRARRRGRARLADRLPRGGELRARPPARNPGELGAAALLERGEVDAALVVASDPLEHAVAARLRELPTVVVDARATATAQAARVAFATAADGIEVPGTVHRMDGVPVPLRAPLAGERPGVEDVLAAIAERL